MHLHQDAGPETQHGLGKRREVDRQPHQERQARRQN